MTVEARELYADLLLDALKAPGRSPRSGPPLFDIFLSMCLSDCYCCHELIDVVEGATHHTFGRQETRGWVGGVELGLLDFDFTASKSLSGWVSLCNQCD